VGSRDKDDVEGGNAEELRYGLVVGLPRPWRVRRLFQRPVRHWRGFRDGTGARIHLRRKTFQRNVGIHQAIGTAAAIGWPLAAAGTAGYILSGISVAGLPSYSIGYVYLPAVLGIVVASMLMAPIGARLAHRTPGKTLRRVFAILLYVLATRMLITFF